MGSIADTERPHAVCIPYPAQGHINPMLNLAKLLYSKGFHITFVHTEYNYKRLLKSRGSDSLNSLPDFQLKTIPDGLPTSDDIDTTQDIPTLCASTAKYCLLPFRNLIHKLNEDINLPDVSCIISDGVMSFTLDVAEELGIPEVLFWTTSACGFMGYLHYPHLIQKGVTPFQDVSLVRNENLETQIDWIDGMNNIRLRDLPSFIRTTDPKDIMLNFLHEEIKRVPRASAMILNTFDALENEVVSAMRFITPPIYTIGSLHLLVKQIVAVGLESVGSNLWKEETECLEWLDSKEPNSVVYVNFGSITVITPQQMIEFGWGLANSKTTFLWVIRPDLVSGSSAFLPLDFLTEINGRSLLTSWCPQEQVLNHPAIGGFLTHSGWNSTIESICSGVPMICWPFFAEQQTNTRYSCSHWGIGMEIDNNIKRDDVEVLVRHLMEGQNGKDLKMKTLEWKKKAEEATAPGGSSYMNIHKLVKEVLLAKKT